MKFFLDLQALQSESRGRGIGRYSRGLADAVLREPAGAEVSVLLNLAIAPFEMFDETKIWALERVPSERIRAFRGLTKIAGVYSCDPGWLHAGEAMYDSYLESLNTDLVHIGSPFEGFGDDTVVGGTELARSGPARAATVYDLIPFEEPQIHLANPVRNFWYSRRLENLKRMDVLLAISAYTREVAISMLGMAPDRVVNIGTDTDPVFRHVIISPDERAALLKHYGISKPFIMHTGVLEDRKNVATLVRAFALLAPEIRATHQLVLVADATDAQIKHMKSIAQSVGLDPACLIFPGFVNDEDLSKIYGLTEVAVMPSLTEGFGLPLLEAMRCGAPVLGSDRTSLPEVVGNRALLFDPAKPSSLAEKLALILSDSGFRNRAVDHSAVQQKKFSWRKSAALTIEAFAETVARKRAGELRTSKSRPHYILVPPVERSDEMQARISRITSDLSSCGDVTVDDPDAEKVIERKEIGAFFLGSELLNLQGNRRMLLLCDEKGLDVYQRALLKAAPAIAVVPDPAVAVPMAPEWIYRREGYKSLLEAGGSASSPLIDLLPKVDTNVLAALSEGAALGNKIEEIYRSHPLAAILRLLATLGRLELPERSAVATVASENHSILPNVPRLLVDISELVKRDAGSGIQRVVKSYLRNLLIEAGPFRVEPVFRDGGVYRYARKFTCEFLGLPTLTLSDAIVDFYETDTYCGLDLDPHLALPASEALARLRRRGGSVNFLIHDCFPLQRPDWFPPRTEPAYDSWFRRVGASTSRIIAVSRSTADETIEMLDRKRIERVDPIEVTWCHNGSDFFGPSSRIPAAAAEVRLPEIPVGREGRPVFLTVGTIEPRKGIGQLIDAAEELWHDQDVVFVIVGKKGWLVDPLIRRIERHREFGKRLLWFGGGVSDEFLGRVYSSATAAVLPTEAEGFGLPLVESARHGLPIIARDIPALREIGGDGVYFFSATDGATLANALRQWLALYREGRAPNPSGVRIENWSDSTRRLLDAMQGRVPYRWWPHAPQISRKTIKP